MKVAKMLDLYPLYLGCPLLSGPRKPSQTLLTRPNRLPTKFSSKISLQPPSDLAKPLLI
jgi:hypothetical protein